VFGYEGIKEDVVKFIELKREEDLKITNNDGSEWEDKQQFDYQIEEDNEFS
jgi:hypothetical protein